MTRSRPQQPRRGVSLPEVIISTLLVGLLIVASMRTITATRLTHRLTADQSAAPGLAQELLSEVLAQPYGDSSSLGPEPSENSRDDYDDVDDYDGYSSAPTTRGGTSIDGYSGWTREVSVRWVGLDMTDATSDQGLKRITVTVSNADGVQAEASGVRSRLGVLEQPVSVDTKAVVWVGATLSLDDATPAARTGVHLPNLVPNPN